MHLKLSAISALLAVLFAKSAVAAPMPTGIDSDAPALPGPAEQALDQLTGGKLCPRPQIFYVGLILVARYRLSRHNDP